MKSIIRMFTFAFMYMALRVLLSLSDFCMVFANMVANPSTEDMVIFWTYSSLCVRSGPIASKAALRLLSL